MDKVQLNARVKPIIKEMLDDLVNYYDERNPMSSARKSEIIARSIEEHHRKLLPQKNNTFIDEMRNKVKAQ
jgi:hypothetical protein